MPAKVQTNKSTKIQRHYGDELIHYLFWKCLYRTNLGTQNKTYFTKHARESQLLYVMIILTVVIKNNNFNWFRLQYWVCIKGETVWIFCMVLWAQGTTGKAIAKVTKKAI